MLRRVCRRTGGTTGPEPVEGTELALEMLERVLELGYLRAEWVAGDDAFGMSPTFRPFDKLRRTGGPGDALRVGRSGRHHGLAIGPGLDQYGISRFRAPPQTQAAGWAAPDHGAAR